MRWALCDALGQAFKWGLWFPSLGILPRITLTLLVVHCSGLGFRVSAHGNSPRLRRCLGTDLFDTSLLGTLGLCGPLTEEAHGPGRRLHLPGRAPAAGRGALCLISSSLLCCSGTPVPKGELWKVAGAVTSHQPWPACHAQRGEDQRKGCVAWTPRGNPRGKSWFLANLSTKSGKNVKLQVGSWLCSPWKWKLLEDRSFSRK